MPIRRPAHGCHGYSSSRNSVLWAFSSLVVQYDQAACLTRLQATCTRGVRARLRRVAGLRRPASRATLAQPPTLNEHSTRTTQWGPIRPTQPGNADGLVTLDWAPSLGSADERARRQGLHMMPSASLRNGCNVCRRRIALSRNSFAYLNESWATPCQNEWL